MEPEIPATTSLAPEAASTPVDWDYEVVMPTNWKIRGRNPTMRLISQDQVERLTTAANPWPLALFTLTGGIAASLFIQLKTGVVDASSRSLLWAIFYPMVILTAALGVSAVRDYLFTRKQKRAVVDELPSVQAEAPVRQLKAK
jgi:hypothetical protein